MKRLTTERTPCFSPLLINVAKFSRNKKGKFSELKSRACVPRLEDVDSQPVGCQLRELKQRQHCKIIGLMSKNNRSASAF